MQDVEQACKGNYYDPIDNACENKLSKVDEVMKAGFETVLSFEYANWMMMTVQLT